MPAALRNALHALFAIGLLAAFVVVYFVAIDRTRGASATPGFSDAFVYWATALSGFVGGAIATAFGVALPNGGGTRGAARLRTLLDSMGRFLVPFLGGVSGRVAVIAAYVVIYLVVVAAAGLTWATESDVMPTVLKSLVTIAAGLAFAMTTAWFRASD